MIKTINNTGWSVIVDFDETFFEGLNMSCVENITSDLNWYNCEIKDKKFQGTGGFLNLFDILNVFKNTVKNGDNFSQ